MQKIKNKIKEIIYDKDVYIFSIITVLFFGIFFIIQYAPDTYSVLTDSLKNRVLHFCSCGRFVSGFYLYFVRGILNIGDRGTYFISYVIAIICMTISLYKLNKIIKKDIKRK